MVRLAFKRNVRWFCNAYESVFFADCFGVGRLRTSTPPDLAHVARHTARFTNLQPAHFMRTPLRALDNLEHIFTQIAVTRCSAPPGSTSQCSKYVRRRLRRASSPGPGRCLCGGFHAMRLLFMTEDGNVSYTEFTPTKIPPYAILSHTWGLEEVIFDDLLSGTARSKAGYRKILFCGQQAARDNLQYFWVDTCCIDKRNLVELTRSINSMFRWYRNAVKCYVYMADVCSSDVFTPAIASSAKTWQSMWEQDFRESRWFTRGWTLQELLAPTDVEFYSPHHLRLGDKKSLCGLIRDITGISERALQGRSLDQFPVSTRLAWAAKRQTTEEEDGAYCLLGLFNIFMPLIYGEGKDNALRRLQKEIDGLPPKGRTPMKAHSLAIC